MVVQKPRKHRGMTGLHVGNGNVQLLFPPDVQLVELELDHLTITCTLEPEFWEGEPEIQDERLLSWLETKQANGKLGPKPAPIAMIPAGEHAFRLMPIGDNEVRTTKYPVSFCA